MSYRLLLLFLLITCSASAQKWNHYSVLFGEASLELPPAPENVVRIFVDQEGFIYPDAFINDRKLRRASSSLGTYFAKHTKELDELCDGYGLKQELADQDKIDWLLAIIAQEKIKEINAKVPQFASVTALIHGFRKKAYGRTGFHSSVDYRALENDMNVKQKNMLIIEVYWDGTFISPIRGYKYRGFRLLEEQAIPNAVKVGEGLRRVLSYVETPSLNVVCHSLGAKVVTNLLFNQSDEPLPTPPQAEINVCMVAPAIGSEEFNAYWNRSEIVENDAYQFYIFFNENDFVLTKTFDVGPISLHLKPTEYGNTSLGCNYNDDVDCVTEILESFPTNANQPKLFDLSTRPNGGIMTCHHLRCYTRFDAFLNLEIW